MTAPAGACSANHVVAPSSASRCRRVTPWPVRKGRSVFNSDSFTIDGLLTFVIDCAVYLPSRLQPMLRASARNHPACVSHDPHSG